MMMKVMGDEEGREKERKLMRQARISDRILPPKPQLPNRHPPILVELRDIIERSNSLGSRLPSLAGALQSALGGHEVRSEDYTPRQQVVTDLALSVCCFVSPCVRVRSEYITESKCSYFTKLKVPKIVAWARPRLLNSIDD